MPRTGFIDHIGIGVPDLAAAKRYYDELMPILGLRQWFKTSPEGSFNYGPDSAQGTQVFFYQALEAGTTHATARACNTSHSWLRAALSSEKHTNGLAHATPRSFTNHGSSPSTASITQPFGSIRTVSSSRSFASILRGSRLARQLQVMLSNNTGDGFGVVACGCTTS